MGTRTPHGVSADAVCLAVGYRAPEGIMDFQDPTGRKKDDALAAIDHLLELVRARRLEFAGLAAESGELVLHEFPDSGCCIVMHWHDLADPGKPATFSLRVPSGEETNYEGRALLCDWRIFASRMTASELEGFRCDGGGGAHPEAGPVWRAVQALLVGGADAERRVSEGLPPADAEWPQGRHPGPAAGVGLDDPTGRRKDRALAAIKRLLRFVQTRRTRLYRSAPLSRELVLYRFPDSGSSVVVYFRDAADWRSPATFTLRAGSGAERAYDGPAALDDWRLFAAHTTLEELEAFCAMDLDRVVFATELVAGDAPDGTGTELEAGTAPGGTGAELEAEGQANGHEHEHEHERLDSSHVTRPTSLRE